MTIWSETARQAIAETASRHGFSPAAGEAMAEAIFAGNGRMAQFGHPDLGGMGQWSRGGMLMIGDMFNNGLKARVGSLAEDIAAALGDGRIAPDAAAPGERSAGEEGSADAVSSLPSAGGLRAEGAPRLGGDAWWPRELGSPGSSGAQNGRRYAVFPDKRRLAVERDGRIMFYDTGEHRIGGVSQAQGGSDTLRFTSQLGSVDLADLPEVRQADLSDGTSRQEAQQPRGDRPAPASGLRTAPAPRLATAADFPAIDLGGGGDAQLDNPAAATGGQDVIDTIRRLAELRDAGVLSEEEFANKKAELLARL